MHLRVVAIALVATAIGVQNAWAVSGPPAVTSQADPNVAATRSELQQATAKAQSSDAAGAIELLKQVVASPALSELSEQERHVAYALLGTLELQASDSQAAYPNLKQATLSSLATDDDWQLRLDAAFTVQDYDDCNASLAVIAERWPATLNAVSDGAMFFLADRAEGLSVDAAVGLLGPLHAAKWHPQDVYDDADMLWFRLAGAYLERGDSAAAQKVLADIDSVEPFIEARSDKRFDSIVALDPVHFDVDAALARAIAKARAQSAAAPDKLEGINNLAETLVFANRPQEALDLLDQAITRAKPSDGSASPFSDFGTKFNWTLDTRSRALLALGRYKEGLDALESGARRPENGDINVSQAINLADGYNSQGRPKDALDAVATLDGSHASPYGRMALAEARACAYAQLGDKANLDTQLAYMTAHVADGKGTTLEALICANDLDGAAKLVMEDLRNPLRRDSMLFRFQDFIHQAGEMAFEKEQRARLVAIRNRPEIAAEISAVGRIGSFPVI